MNRENARTQGAPKLGWLTLGAAAGLAAAAWGLLERAPAERPLPPDAVARVNDTLIDRAIYERALERLAGQRGDEPTDELRVWALETLVEQELLVQRGIELGIPATDGTVRAAIIQSLVASVTAEADAADPTEAELQAFLEANADRYTYATALDVDAWVTDDEAVARAFLASLPGGEAAPPGSLRRVPGLPASALPLERLRMFLGPAITAAATEMPPGAGAVYPRQGRWYVVRVNAHGESVLAELEAVRSQVLVDYRQSLAEERLEEYVLRLMQQADVTVAAP